MSCSHRRNFAIDFLSRLEFLVFQMSLTRSLLSRSSAPPSFSELVKMLKRWPTLVSMVLHLLWPARCLERTRLFRWAFNLTAIQKRKAGFPENSIEKRITWIKLQIWNLFSRKNGFPPLHCSLRFSLVGVHFSLSKLPHVLWSWSTRSFWQPS